MLWLAWLASAHAAPVGSDVAITSVGAQFVQVPTVEETDLDLLLAERARLTFMEKDRFTGRLLVDARFTIDTSGGDTFEWNNVRQLGVSLHRPTWTLDIGRHPVLRGGPRIVDGMQLLFHPSPRLDVGLWGGLAPDLFTTLPRIRPGGGPIVSYTAPSFQTSLVGEALVYDGGVDRVATIAMVRKSFQRIFEVAGRGDIEFVGDNGPHLADAWTTAIWRPTDAVRIDGLYNAFSTYKYQLSEVQDPKVQRYAQRIADLGIALGIQQDELDPELNHQVGGNVVLQPDNGGTAPRLQLQARQRFNDNELNRFTRLGAQTGIVDIGLAGRLDVLADGNLIFADGETQLNPGVMLLWEPGEEVWFAIDASGRVLINPEYDGQMGLYGDVFLDAVTPANIAVNLGVSLIHEPDPDIEVPDMALQGYARVSYYLRPNRKKAPSSTGFEQGSK
mgnify:FL=1